MIEVALHNEEAIRGAWICYHSSIPIHLMPEQDPSNPIVLCIWLLLLRKCHTGQSTTDCNIPTLSTA